MARKKHQGKGRRARPPGPARERFLLGKLLGAGGISEVHSALDLRRVEWGDSNPRVALKRLKPAHAGSARARLALAQEFCVLRHLTHPGVVRVFDLHEEPFGICFTMELLEGRTLQEELLKRPAGLGAAAPALGESLFDALAYLHRHGVVHGDIKPSNVFIAQGKRIALIDFNVATATARAGAASSPITRGLREPLRLPSFSLRYAAPERLQGGAPSAPDDIFAACCTVYEAAAGAHPFGRQSSEEAASEKRLPARPAALALRQWRSLQKGLSFAPLARPDADALLAEFSQAGFLRGLKQTIHSVIG